MLQEIITLVLALAALMAVAGGVGLPAPLIDRLLPHKRQPGTQKESIVVVY